MLSKLLLLVLPLVANALPQPQNPVQVITSASVFTTLEVTTIVQTEIVQPTPTSTAPIIVTTLVPESSIVNIVQTTLVPTIIPIVQTFTVPSIVIAATPVTTILDLNTESQSATPSVTPSISIQIVPSASVIGSTVVVTQTVVAGGAGAAGSNNNASSTSTGVTSTAASSSTSTAASSTTPASTTTASSSASTTSTTSTTASFNLRSAYPSATPGVAIAGTEFIPIIVSGTQNIQQNQTTIVIPVPNFNAPVSSGSTGGSGGSTGGSGGSTGASGGSTGGSGGSTGGSGGSTGGSGGSTGASGGSTGASGGSTGGSGGSTGGSGGSSGTTQYNSTANGTCSAPNNITGLVVTSPCYNASYLVGTNQSVSWDHFYINGTAPPNVQNVTVDLYNATYNATANVIQGTAVATIAQNFTSSARVLYYLAYGLNPGYYFYYLKDSLNGTATSGIFRYVNSTSLLNSTFTL